MLKRLEYRPKILLDSGAYTAWTKGIEIDLRTYCDFIRVNASDFENYIALDVIGNDTLSFVNYERMLEASLNPIPVFHCNDDWGVLNEYAKRTKHIALAGLMSYRHDKVGMAGWINLCRMQHPEVSFHILGTTSRIVQENCIIKSMDSATWVTKAYMGNELKFLDNSYESKLRRAVFELNGGRGNDLH